MTVAEILQDAIQRFERQKIISAHSDAEWLLAQALGFSRMDLLLSKKNVVSAEAAKTFESWVKRREAREPLQWILGETNFFGLKIFSEPGVLIPRPETERLVEIVLTEIKAKKSLENLKLLDVGTGTGAVALAIKEALPQLQVFATDINPVAIELAKRNAKNLGLKIQFGLGDLAAGFLEHFDVIVSNPPYLPLNDAKELSAEVLREPKDALFAGEDGLDVAKKIVALSETGALVPSGLLALELDPRNAGMLAESLNKKIWQDVFLHKDLLERERFVVAGKI